MLKPRKNYVLVEIPPSPTEEKTKGGIIKPLLLQSIPPTIGIIKALGPDVPKDLRVSLMVRFNQHAGQDIPDDGKLYKLMEEQHITAVL